MNKLLVRTFEMFFELHVIGSFDAPKNAILKNYVIFYSETKNKYCSHQIIIPIGGQRYFLTNYVFLFHC